jgi:hypothetical protein
VESHAIIKSVQCNPILPIDRADLADGEALSR